MHEYSIVQAMFTRIEEAARGQGAIAVRHVKVRIGQLAGVDVGLLQTAYEMYRADTICDGATLGVTVVPARWCCPEGHGDLVAGQRLTCTQCGRAARLAAGDEIILEQLELEVP